MSRVRVKRYNPKQVASVESTLAEKSDVEFFTLLCALVDPKKTAGQENESPAAMVAATFDGLFLYGGNDGLWKFLEAYPVGRHLPNLVPWANAIGATKVAAYCAAGVRILPRGRVPADDAFMRWLEKLEDDARKLKPRDKWYGVDALRRVDKEHSGALDELAPRLREFLRKNADDPIAAFERLFKKAPSKPLPKPEPPKMGPMATLKSAGANLKARGAEVLRLATERGRRTIDGKEDPRMTRFIAGLAGITEKQWMAIAETYYTNSHARRRAAGTISSVTVDMVTGRILPQAQEQRLMKPAAAARERARAIVARLPVEPHPKGGKISFPKLAGLVMNDVWLGLTYIDFIAVTDAGLKALRTVGKPFVGLTELPPEMLPPATGRKKSPT